MDKDIAITNGLIELSQVFRRKLSPEVERIYRSKFEPYHVKTIMEFFRVWVDTQERFPYIHEVMTRLRDQEEIPPVNWIYEIDGYRQNKFPMAMMNRAYKILVEIGEKSFLNYCEQVNMPKEDIDGIMAKYNCVIGENTVENMAKDLFEPIDIDINLTDEEKKTETLREKARRMKRKKFDYHNEVRKE